jgi:hypothetical protein
VAHHVAPVGTEHVRREDDVAEQTHDDPSYVNSNVLHDPSRGSVAAFQPSN